MVEGQQSALIALTTDRQTEMVVLESSMLTSQDHMERKKRAVYVCASCLLELLGSEPPKAPQHLHLLEHEHFNEKCSGNMLLKGKDLEQL